MALHGDPSRSGNPPADASEALREARRRRAALGEAMGRTERALAVPSGSATWRAEVTVALQQVRVALDDHVSEVEGEQGLLRELRQVAPRLSGRIDQLEGEHPQLGEGVERALLAVAGAPPAEVRAMVLDLLLAISRHRQRGADLVFEAYNVDIGGQ